MEQIYWGILCKTCLEPVAFDLRPFGGFGLGSEICKPGSVACSHGHDHIYFPRDFHFLRSAAPIAREMIRANCAAYRLRNVVEPMYSLSA
jgi:hypothetical protein